MPRDQGDADAGRAFDLLPLDDVCLRCRLHESLRHMFYVINCNARQHDRELVPAEPSKDVLGPQTKFKPVAECLEQRIARPVPEAIIDLLEIVQIEVQHGPLFALSNSILALFFETAPVQYVGQRIAQRVGEHFIFVAFALCDVNQRYREVFTDWFGNDAQPVMTIRCFGRHLEAGRRPRHSFA